MKNHIYSLVCFVLLCGCFKEQSATPNLLFPASGIPDVCVYGATSGGVVAAVAAARLGARVVLVEPGNHSGGMTAGGLSFTDTGHADTIGGMAREFYRRVGRSYGTGEQFIFEPHIALKVFSDLLAEQGIRVEYGAQISEVVKEGPRILEIRAVDGRTFKGKMFIDATYEGDLMAKAGVSYIVGRESTSTYQEPLNGIRPKSASRWIDPYVIPGKPSSGLLPLVQPETSGQVGEADHLVQAYNYRLCLTQNPSNRLPITPPPKL